MIINPITNNQSIIDSILKNDPSESIWIVSNLKSKLEIQKTIQDQFGYFENESVLRVNEFFKMLILRSRPEVKIISKDHAILLISQKLNEMEDSVGQIHLKKSAQTIYNYITELACVFVHPQGIERLSDWLSGNEMSQKKWGHWFQISQTIFSWFLGKNIISQDWLSPLLTQVDLSDIKINKKIFINLGFDILDYELEIFKNLSLSETTYFESKIDNKIEKSEDRVELYKFSTCVNEVKFLTQKIRSLIEKNVKPSQIVVYAAEIEYFWPVLRRYFSQEGIICNKKSVLKAHSLPGVLKWISQIQLSTKQIQFSDLEQAQFILQENHSLKYEKFLELFKNIYDFTDLSRDSKIYELYSKNINLKDEINRNEFLTWTLQFWPQSENQEILLSGFKKLIQEIGSEEVFYLSSWIEYLKKIFSQTEITIEEGARDGVQISNLYSSFNNNPEYRFFIGLTEGALSLSPMTQINESEKNRINSDLGFKIPTKSELILVNELEWILNLESKKDYLSYSSTDFSGELTSPHNIWLKIYLNKYKKLPEIADAPEMTSWDSLQRSELETIAQKTAWSSQQKSILKTRVQVDLGQLDSENGFSIEKPIFSPSSLEKLFKCPFMFVAERLYRLLDPVCLDLEVTNLEQGNIKHALLEWITSQPTTSWTWSFSELDQILTQIVSDKKINIPDLQIWKHQKVKLLNSILKFIQLEKEYLNQFSNYKILFREKEFEFKINPSDPITIKGKVDRIDEAEGEAYLIIDYKSGASNIKSFSKAYTEGALQLPVYTMAFDKNLNQEGLESKNVISAQFYNLKNFKRDQGFLLKESDGLYYKIGSKKYGMTEPEKLSFLNQLQSDITHKVDQLQKGIISPKPINTDICTQCHWRTLCRAPHLY